MQTDEYQKYIDDTLERKDLEGLFGIWSTSRNQGKFGKKTRQLIKDAVPTLASFHHLELEENTFQNLMEKYDDERVLQFAIQNKNYLQHFLETDDLAGLKRVLAFQTAQETLAAVEALKVSPTLRVLEYLVPIAMQKSHTTENLFYKFTFFNALAFLAGKANSQESIDYLHSINPGRNVLNSALPAVSDISLIEKLVAAGADPDRLLNGIILRNDWALLDFYRTKYDLNQETLQQGLLHTTIHSNYQMMRYFFSLGAFPADDILDVPAANGDLKAIDIFVEFGLTKETILSVLKMYAENDFSGEGYVKYTLAKRGADYLQKLCEKMYCNIVAT